MLMQQATENPQPKVQTFMEALIQSFSDQLDRMAKNTERLRILGDRLHADETIANKTASETPYKASGLMSSIEAYRELLISLNCAQETQLQKLENLL